MAALATLATKCTIRGGLGAIARPATKGALGIGPGRKMVLAACYPSEIPKTVRVAVRQLEFDPWLKMYFSHYAGFYAADPGNVKQGDVVLIKELEEKERTTRDITHEILKMVYPLGDATDPITGRKCMGIRFRDVEDQYEELWGKNPNAFDYDKAPPRGWQEGRKDWSHKRPYRKFHEFTDRDQTEASWI